MLTRRSFAVLLFVCGFSPFFKVFYGISPFAFQFRQLNIFLSASLLAFTAVVTLFRWLTFEWFPKGEAVMLFSLAALLLYSSVKPSCHILFPGLICVLLYTFWRIQVRGPKPRKLLELQDQVFVITGCNSGIGVETARSIADRGAHVIMACRTRKTADPVARDIIASTGNSRVEVVELDLGSFASVRKFTEEIHKRFESIDGVISNAGVMKLGYTETVDRLETMMQVNCVSVYLLLMGLIPLLCKSKIPGGPRITLVGSNMHKRACLEQGGFDFENNFSAKGEDVFSMVRFYGQSKLGLELLKKELVRRLELKGINIQVNSLNPGTIVSNISRDFPSFLNKFHWLIQPINKTAKTGSYTTVHVAASQEVEGITGGWFEHCTNLKQALPVYDTDDAAKLWALLETKTNMVL